MDRKTWVFLGISTCLGCAFEPATSGDLAEDAAPSALQQALDRSKLAIIKIPKDFWPVFTPPESDQEAALKFRPRAECTLYKHGTVQSPNRLDATKPVNLGVDQVCVETGHTGPRANVAYVDVDNPRIWTGVTLPERTGVSGRIYAERTTAFSWVSVDSDFSTRIGEPWNWIRNDRFHYRGTMTNVSGRTVSWVNLNSGTYDDYLIPWPDADGAWGGSDPRDLTILGHGARVGYRNTATATTRSDRDGVPYYGALVDVELDPSVSLVPIQALVPTSPSYPQAMYQGDGQLALWDRVPTIANTQTWGSVIEREWNADTWVRGVVHPVGGYYGAFMVPDDPWNQCGIQFRLAAHNSFALSDADMQGDLNNARKLSRGIVEKFMASESYVPGMPIVLFLPSYDGERNFTDTTSQGERYTCMATNPPGRFVEATTRLAYELGSLLGVQDPGTYCQTDPDNLMCKYGGVSLTLAQCKVARVRAGQLKEQFFPPPLVAVDDIILPWRP